MGSRLPTTSLQRDKNLFSEEETLLLAAADLGIVEVAGDPLKDDGPIFQGGPHLAEAQAELGVDGAQGLQAELLSVVQGQQGRHQLVQLLLGLLPLDHHALMQPASMAQAGCKVLSWLCILFLQDEKTHLHGTG